MCTIVQTAIQSLNIKKALLFIGIPVVLRLCAEFRFLLFPCIIFRALVTPVLFSTSSMAHCSRSLSLNTSPWCPFVSFCLPSSKSLGFCIYSGICFQLEELTVMAQSAETRNFFLSLSLSCYILCVLQLSETESCSEVIFVLFCFWVIWTVDEDELCAHYDDFANKNPYFFFHSYFVKYLLYTTTFYILFFYLLFLFDFSKVKEKYV